MRTPASIKCYISCMDDGEYFVDILDKNGKHVDQKPRKDIVKGQDIYHAVYCVLITPNGDVCLNLIAKRDDMPNLHAGKLGFTAATIKRSGEMGDEAAARAVKNELHLAAMPTLLHEEMLAVDGTYRKVGIYKITSEKPTDFNRQDIEDIVAFTKPDLAKKLADEPSLFSPLIVQFAGQIV